jgi:hypothetical protein
VSELDRNLPPNVLRAQGLRVDHRGDRLIVKTGPPALLAAVATVSLPSMGLVRFLTSGRWDPGAAQALALFVALGALAWLGVTPWTLTLDREKGVARLWRGPWRSERSLASFTGVRFCSLLQAQIEQVRRRRTVMPYAPFGDVGCCVALVDSAGRRWRVTRSDDRSGLRPRRADTEQAARLVASYLGVPFVPPYPTPPGGAVPPAWTRTRSHRRSAANS